MAKIYFIRHAESVANTEGIYQGQTYDTPLSPLGIRQADAIAKRFKDELLIAIYASPLMRTQQTAQAIIEYHSRIPLITENMIMETNHGLWEGRKIAYIQKKWPDIYQTWLTHPVDVAFPEGETFDTFMERVVVWWQRFVRTAKGTIVVVTHDNFIRMLLVYLLRMNGNSLWTFQLQPTGIITVNTVGTKTKIEEINDKNHLEGLEANLAKHAF
jgi:broad specificity phosphatase PhoE